MSSSHCQHGRRWGEGKGVDAKLILTMSYVKVARTEKVDLRLTKHKKTIIDQEYGHNFPDARVSKML